jgi:hypothetical protein
MIRDTYSKALVETDVIEVQKYRKEKQRDREFQAMKKDLNDIKMCINRMSTTLQRLEINNGKD